MKNGDVDEEVAVMKRRVSFHGDTEASTSGGEAVTNPDADVEQMSTSSGRPPSLVTTFANTLRSRANRRKSRSSFDSRDSTGSRRFSFSRMRGSSHNNSMNGGADGRRDGLTKTLSKRISLAEKQMIEQEHQNSSWFKWWHAVFIFCGVSLIACLCQLFLPYPYGLMMTSAQIAEIGIAPEGCQGGLETVSYTHLTLPTTPYV